MKKLILILTLVSLSLCSFAQQDNKEKYKDFKPCNECLDKWSTGSGYETSSSTIKNNTNTNTQASHPVTGQISQESKRIIGTVVGVFVTAVSALIYVKTTNAANGIH